MLFFESVQTISLIIKMETFSNKPHNYSVLQTPFEEGGGESSGASFKKYFEYGVRHVLRYLCCVLDGDTFTLASC